MKWFFVSKIFFFPFFFVQSGASVKKGEPIFALNAMKMETLVSVNLFFFFVLFFHL